MGSDSAGISELTVVSFGPHGQRRGDRVFRMSGWEQVTRLAAGPSGEVSLW